MYLWNPNICPFQLDVQETKSASHSSTDSEIISLDAGLRMDGLLALDLWDVVIEVSRSSNNTKTPTNPAAGNCSRNHKSKPKQKGNRDVDQLSHVDNTTNANSSQGESRLYICEDSEAVIKMIIEDRSPTMRHVSRTHRVAFDWLFDRVNLEPKIQIKYVDTKIQIARMLSKGSFTRDEWCHLIRLLNIMNSSMFSCSHFLSHRKLSVMSKRAQESASKEVSAVAKPRPMNVASRNLVSAKKMILRKILVIRIAR